MKRTKKPTIPAPVPTSSRRRSGDVATVTAYVPATLARSLRIRAAENGCTASSIVTAALSAHLGGR